MPPFLLINPLSGSYSQALRNKLLAQLESAGITPRVMTVTGPEDARRVCALIEDSVENPLILVAGGDGTINAVINALAPGRSTLGILPVGTANVLAHELGVGSVETAIECIAAGKRRPLAVGLLENDAGLSLRFVLMAGVGLDGGIVHGVRSLEKRFLKKGAYLLSALRILLEWPRGRFPVVADGCRLECHSVIICNGARYGGNFKLIPEADISEPSLDLFCITSESRSSYLGIIASVLSGRYCERNDVKRLHASRITVGGDRPIQLDGDGCGRAPVKIGVLANFAGILTP